MLTVWTALAALTAIVGLGAALSWPEDDFSAAEACGDALLAERLRVEQQLVSSGGVVSGRHLCPASTFDVLTPVEGLDPPPAAGSTPMPPQMTVEGLDRFIRDHDIDSIDELLGYFPEHYRNNFSLVEHTRATGQSNLEFPRIVLFGSDGHFLLNVGTKADDPKYDLLDVAELHEATGRWEFSVFDFSGEQPTLTRNDPSCVECHGSTDSRPVWGTNLEWTGVFGDNVAVGPQGEALDTRHLLRIREIMAGEGGSPRFDFLRWREEPLRRGGKRRIAHHAFGAELILSNIAIGSATARGAFQRLRNNPDYPKRREALLHAYYVRKGDARWRPEYSRALGLGDDVEGGPQVLDALLRTLGLDPREAFSLATLARKEEPQTDWSMGRGDLYDLLALQILDDLVHHDDSVARRLRQMAVVEGVLGCPTAARTIADVVDFKMLHLFHLQGRARYQVNRVFYALDLEDVYSRVFEPMAPTMTGLLQQRLRPRSGASP